MQNKKTFALGMLLGMAIMLGVSFGIGPVRSHVVWGRHMPPDAKVLEIYRVLESYSIVPINRDVLLDSMYQGMLEGVGDPYTYYFNREALAVFLERNAGSYAGVGMVVTMDLEDNKVTVVTVFSGSPAEEAGLLPGDKLIWVDGEDMIGKRVDEVTSRVRGIPGSTVRLRVLRGEETINVMLTRQQIYIPTVSHRMLDGDIGLLRIESFDQITITQFSEAYIDLRNQGMRGMIIDLRNNPGGSLDTVVHISNLLLPEGVILYTEDSRGNRRYYRSQSGNRIDEPLVILVNGGSASASEVLTGAVRDHGVGTVVGQQTFGKGVVQSLITLSDGSAVKVTTSRYYTPNGISIHGEGIRPDFIVEVDRETAMMSARLELEDDIQLQKAISVMENKLEN